jgi:hypothetical protein
MERTEKCVHLHRKIDYPEAGIVNEWTITEALSR